MKSKFQHRHYVAIADVIANCPINDEGKAALISDMASMFRQDNPSFSRDRFYWAAHGTPKNGRDKPR